MIFRWLLLWLFYTRKLPLVIRGSENLGFNRIDDFESGDRRFALPSPHIRNSIWPYCVCSGKKTEGRLHVLTKLRPGLKLHPGRNNTRIENTNG